MHRTFLPSFAFAPQSATQSVPQETGLGSMPEWDLSDLYGAPDAPEVQRDLKAAANEATRIKSAYQGRLADLARDGGKLAGAIKDYEKLSDLVGKLGSYSGLYYVLNQTDPARAKFNADVSEALTKLYTDLIFFELELNQIDDETIAAATRHEEVKRYKPWLDDLRKEKPHQLDEKLETLFTEKSQTGRGAWTRLFNETMSALKFEVKGEKEPLSVELTLNLLSDPDEKKRKAAAEALSKVFTANLPLFTLITNTLAKDKEISDRWRNFKDVADSRNLANRVEAPVVDALVSSVRAAYPLLSHRYYAMKAKWLGKKKLPYWDRNAPLPDKPERIISWSEAEKIVLGAYNGFAPEMATIAKQFFDKNWIDAPVKPGKAPGAFSASTVPSVHPYVMMNYLGKPRDVMTLAHELGHGVHQWLARDQGPLLAPTPLTLAETASVFAEALTFEKLKEREDDPRALLDLLVGRIDDTVATVFRQIAMNRFEHAIHTGRREEGELTVERISELWSIEQRRMLGDAVEVTDDYGIWWSYIPHFIQVPGYVYAYSFGYLFSLAIYRRYLEEGDSLVEPYFDLLRAGGSAPPAELASRLGFDIGDPAFWSAGLDAIGELVDEAERLAAQLD